MPNPAIQSTEFDHPVLRDYWTDFDNFLCFWKLKVRIFWFSHFWKDPRGFWDNTISNPDAPYGCGIWRFFIAILSFLVIFYVLESWKFVFFGFLIFEKIHVDLETTPDRIPVSIEIHRIAVKNGHNQCWKGALGFDMGLSQNPRGSFQKWENQKIRTFSFPEHQKLLKTVHWALRNR